MWVVLCSHQRRYTKFSTHNLEELRYELQADVCYHYRQDINARYSVADKYGCDCSSGCLRSRHRFRQNLVPIGEYYYKLVSRFHHRGRTAFIHGHKPKDSGRHNKTSIFVASFEAYGTKVTSCDSSVEVTLHVQ